MEMGMQFVFLLCIVLFYMRIQATNTAAAESQRDRDALLAIKSNIMQDPEGICSSWNESLHFCNWQGVECGRRHRRVTILDLSSRGLVGSLSPYVGNLSFLIELRLDNNTLQGKIPPEFGRLFRLKALNLSINSLEGEIPGNLSYCSNLAFLNLGFNNLVGKIPLELASLSKLKILYLYYNNLTGGIPPSIGNLTFLQRLSTANNLLGGTIPNAFQLLENLTSLTLGGNEFFGTIPPSIYNLTFLSTLSLPSNQLDGSLPPNFGLSFPHLQNLQLWENRFSGSIPGSLSNASNLQVIEMDLNNFTGKVSVDFKALQGLSSISLGENNLGSGEADEMSFLISLLNCSNLEYLGIQENHFRGTLPSIVANFSTTLPFTLDLGENQLSGYLPSWIGTLIHLTVLRLENNRFTGTIPDEIGKLQKLQRLYLTSNSFSGKIPSSLGNLALLNELDLTDNNLQGTIPSSLGSCQNLYLLSLSQNSLSGSIPAQLFNALALSIILDLSQNHLVGSLPSEIGNLEKLSKLDVFENKLSGEIPSNLGGCFSLEYLSMAGNFFQGSIPPSLSSLRGIRNFDLSRNNLSGQVPVFLEKFSLENLNLSFNDFEGELPMKGDFINASAVSVAGNKRLCGGIPKLQLPKCTIKESKRRKLSFVLILIISIVCVLVVSTVSFLLFCWFKKKSKGQSLGSLLGESFLTVSYGTLLKATEGFSLENLIGAGSFGSVYKGILDQNGIVVAVKVFNLQHRGASKSFMAECEALRNIRHRNLLKIITCCSSVDFQGNDFKALVYEFMPNGSLERWLHPILETDANQDEVQNLNLLERINLAIDVACALDYLQHHCQKPIIHCDLKPSNILLDTDMIARVGDFGLARFIPEMVVPSQSSSVGIRGTIGYAAPEYGVGSEVSSSGDVYSYGILLLEMMTGKRPTDPMFSEGLNLHNFARMALPDGVMEIVDPILINEHEEAAINNNHRARQIRNERRILECLTFMIKIGVACSVDSPQDRMDISNVLHELHLVRDIFQGTRRNMDAEEQIMLMNVSHAVGIGHLSI